MFERLTERDEYGNTDIVGVESADLQLNLEFDEFNKVTNALNRLAAYEDTGLAPEQIEALTADKDEQAGRIMRYDTALRQAKEALKYCAISACKPAQGVVESQIRAIDALLGGKE